MDNTKFTKGNWIIEYSDRDNSYYIYNESKDEFVCTTMNSLDINKYNALLISKAPEMFEKLILISNIYPALIEEDKEILREIKKLIKDATEL